MTPVAAVRASGLVKRFETTVAVDHVDLVVLVGEVRGLLGPTAPARPRRCGAGEARARVDDVLDQVGLSGRAPTG